MMTPEKRIKELYARQIFYGSSMYVQLRAEKGLYYYDIKLIARPKSIFLADIKGQAESQIFNPRKVKRDKDGKILSKVFSKQIVQSGKYNGEDPEILFKQVEEKIGRWKCGKPRQHYVPTEIQT